MSNKTLKKEIMNTINNAIKNDRQDARTPQGIEVDILPEWRDYLHQDSSIIRSYEKVGWRIVWYNIHSEGPALGDLVRSWFALRPKDYRQGDKK
jgi:hypothetical protein